MSADAPNPCALVIFGATGDLTRRKLIPALYHLDRAGFLPEHFSIYGYGRRPKSDDEFRQDLREGTGPFLPEEAHAETAWDRFAERLHYVQGQYDAPEDLARLSKSLAEEPPACACRDCVYYLALPPSASESLLSTFQSTALPNNVRARLLMEKPFGTDLESARRLNALTAQSFDESQVYRIDHYMAKDTVRNLLTFRFTNAIFEPLWNRNYIDNVQVTAAEAIGIEGRGGYYEESGVVRDMLQNHVLQVLALVTMEPPLAGDAESVRNRKLDIFRSILPLQDGDYAFGQYSGYQEENGVQTGSRTPTYAALKLQIDNWRWQGVPFYIRSGKAMARKVTEVVIQFKRVPLCVLDDPGLCRAMQPNELVLRIQPDEGIALRFNLQRPGHADALDSTQMAFRYASLDSAPAEAYERVLLDAFRGRPTLFWHSDAIEAAWATVTPLLELREPPEAYEAGSWGPAGAEELLRSDRRRWALPNW